MQQQRQAHKPLAEKLRPMNLDDFTGQEHILGKDKILRRIIESDRIIPMIFWGPPGCGKTTLAKIIAEKTDSLFVFFSAVTGGIADARKIMATASENSKNGKKTILFVDEIHRFNKSQQDYFLPFVENGTITLLGATTENPSFQVNAPLLSRARVFHFRELTEDEIGIIIDKAIKKINADFEQFFPSLGCHSCEGMNLENRSRIKSGMTQKDIEVSIDKTAKHLISKLSEGDARDAYNALELAIIAATPKDGVITIDEELAEESIQQKFIRYDKGADGHYDAISALHKAIRASQIDASLHYLARMLEAGEDPLYVTRRLVRCASEDIGIVDPQALILAVATQQAVHFMGMPESNDAIAQLVIYLAKAPKSRAVDDAYAAAKKDVIENRLNPIPLKIRNAPTKMMKEFGFGKGYQLYDETTYLPENIKDHKYWKEN